VAYGLTHRRFKFVLKQMDNVDMEIDAMTSCRETREQGLLRFMLKVGGRLALTIFVLAFAFNALAYFEYDRPWKIAYHALISVTCGVVVSLASWIFVWWFCERRSKRTPQTGPGRPS